MTPRVAASEQTHTGLNVRPALVEQFSSLLYGHVAAFRHFEGVPWTIVYDRQAAVTPYSIGGKPVISDKFDAFAKHYGFDIHICLPRRPQRKGKDERAFDYFEKSFLRGRKFESLEHFNKEVDDWLAGIDDPEEGNLRVHGTTREVPHERWMVERQFLYELPATDHLPRRVEKRVVCKDCTISVLGCRYTVPPRFVGKDVWVSTGADELLVYDDHGQRIAEHKLSEKKGALVIDEEHYSQISRQRKRLSLPALERRFLELFPGSEEFVSAVKRTMRSIAPIHLKTILALATRYRVESVRQAVVTALDHGTPTAGYVRQLLSRSHPTGHIGEIQHEIPKGLSIGPIDAGEPQAFDEIFDDPDSDPKEASDDDTEEQA